MADVVGGEEHPGVGGGVRDGEGGARCHRSLGHRGPTRGHWRGQCAHLGLAGRLLLDAVEALHVGDELRHVIQELSELLVTCLHLILVRSQGVSLYGVMNRGHVSRGFW